MTKTFLAAILAGTLALTSVAATPASANGNDLAKAIVGIAAFGLIVSAIDKANRREQAAKAQPVHNPNRRYDNRRSYDRWDRDNDWRNNNRGNKYRRFVIPSRCVKSYLTADGRRAAVSPRCVEKRAPRVALPSECRRTLWTDRGRLQAYSRRCLTRQGYTFS